MTIKEYIVEKTTASVMDRWSKLTEMGAPDVLIRSCEEELKRLANRDLRCGGDIELLDEEFVSDEIRKEIIKIQGE